MPRPKKAYKVVGKDKKIHIPQPPAKASHVHLQVGNRKAVVPIEDFDNTLEFIPLAIDSNITGPSW